MVTRVDKFLGGLGADVTNVANVHATQNRITLGGLENPSANAHVIGTVLATTNAIVGATAVTSGHTFDVRGTANTGAITATTIALSADGGVQVPNDGNIGSAGATDAIQIASDGIVTFKDDIKIKDGGTIGVASKADAVTIAAEGDTAIAGGLGIAGNTAPVATALSLGTPANVVVRTHAASGAGNVIIGDVTATSSHNLDVRGTANTGALTGTTGTFSGRLVVDDTTEATTTTDGSLQTDGGLSVAGDAVFGDDIKLVTDAAVASFGQNGEITLTHVHDTGLLLKDSGGSPTLQFHDAGESISSDGSKLILTTNSVALSMPTADGSDGQALVTDGAGTLSFTTISTATNPVTVLGSNHDCGAVTGGTNDAFNIATSSLTVLDLLTDPERQLGTADQGALS